MHFRARAACTRLRIGVSQKRPTNVVSSFLGFTQMVKAMVNRTFINLSRKHAYKKIYYRHARGISPASYCKRSRRRHCLAESAAIHGRNAGPCDD
jgi:hypothetical protein